MSFQKIALICLVAIGVGAAGGMLDVKFTASDSKLVSKQIQKVQIQQNAAASTIISSVEKEALRREKAAGLGEFLASQEDEAELAE